jgi:hypothetical protein
MSGFVYDYFVQASTDARLTSLRQIEVDESDNNE